MLFSISVLKPGYYSATRFLQCKTLSYSYFSPYDDDDDDDDDDVPYLLVLIPRDVQLIVGSSEP